MRKNEAFLAFRRAIEEGEVADFLSLVSEDFYFTVPLPLAEWKGEQRGTRRFEELIRFEREHLAVRLTPVIELEDDRCGIVVFRAEGTLDGAPYGNELAILFEFEKDRIRSFREYVGSTQYMADNKGKSVS
ncbi:nuclear transport factor 2 family protein [Paenibacillus hamazuiensis]|uniref:nuclear transport factor 2 family protein n=1 Tax=Paenibacillus hamazuiensis TaxID=2936508 RepID=UPI00200D2960|nr:nuclear transport factor 2 family protein [Paenibacillus hamazuiensis]